jgi:hypothetical protein
MSSSKIINLILQNYNYNQIVQSKEMIYSLEQKLPAMHFQSMTVITYCPKLNMLI